MFSKVSNSFKNETRCGVSDMIRVRRTCWCESFLLSAVDDTRGDDGSEDDLPSRVVRRQDQSVAC